ncbi:hypothetical protein pipiens_012197, partial [Culex pipiens pipiens]
MVIAGRLLLLLIPYIECISSTSKYPKTLVTYTVSLIEHLASKQSEIFDCWLYHACSDPPGTSGLLQEIAVQLQRIPRRTIDSRFPWSGDASEWKAPSLVIIHVEFTSHKPAVMDNVGELLGFLDRQTKILVLLSTRSRLISVVTFASPITTGKLFNMAFLSVDQELLIFPDIKAKRFAKFRKLWAHEAMFPDQSRYLHGTPLWYSVFNGLLNACIGNNCAGYDVSVVEEFARYLNTTTHYERFVCPYKIDRRKQSVAECVYSVMMEPDCLLDVFADPSTAINYMKHYQEEPIPHDKVLIAPRGRSLNIAELFLRPFQTKLWILFFIGMASVKLISLLIPNAFKNDPLLLPICGFERLNLNQADRKEKVVMISLIVLFFFVSNAYESKIISLMSSKPRITAVTTIQDILDTGTPVKAGYMSEVEFPIFKSLYIYQDESPNQLDGTSVYLTNGAIAAHMVQRKVNWDYESNQPRYKVMHEVLALLIGFYPMPIRSALKPHFRFVLKALREAGILDRWRRDWFKRGDLRYSDPTQAGGVNPGSDILKFLDLRPA